MQLSMGAQHFGVKARVVHTVQLLDEAYQREDAAPPTQTEAVSETETPEPVAAGEPDA
jgi:hypothetical protein